MLRSLGYGHCHGHGDGHQPCRKKYIRLKPLKIFFGLEGPSPPIPDYLTIQLPYWLWHSTARLWGQATLPRSKSLVQYMGSYPGGPRTWGGEGGWGWAPSSFEKNVGNSQLSRGQAATGVICTFLKESVSKKEVSPESSVNWECELGTGDDWWSQALRQNLTPMLPARHWT